MSGLESTNSVIALVPGEPGILHDRAYNWRERGRDYQSIHDVLVALDLASFWTGEAGAAAESGIHRAAQSWAHAAIAHQMAADELDAYATILSEAQDDARRAIATYGQGQAATAHARKLYEDQVSTGLGGLSVLQAPSQWVAEQFIDPGTTFKLRAEKILDNAVASVQSAGDTAATALGEAMDAAQIVDGLLAFAGVFFQQQARTVVNSIASLGNAMLQHPDLTLGLITGSLLIDAAAGGEIGGVALDATGVGALGGVPLNIDMVGVGVAGVTATGAAASQLAADAMSDSNVEPWKNENHGNGTSASSRVDDELSKLDRGRTPPNRQVDSVRALDEVYRALAEQGHSVESRYPGALTRLDDGTTIGLRPESKSGGPTIDVTRPDGSVIKVHVK